MKANQEYSPKYWVVHDTEDLDIFKKSMSKNKNDSIESFMGVYGFETLGLIEDTELLEAFQSQTRYECILIEIKQVIL